MSAFLSKAGLGEPPSALTGGRTRGLTAPSCCGVLQVLLGGSEPRTECKRGTTVEVGASLRLAGRADWRRVFGQAGEGFTLRAGWKSGEIVQDLAGAGRDRRVRVGPVVHGRNVAPVDVELGNLECG